MAAEMLSYAAFLRGLPPALAQALPDGSLLKSHQPFGGILQFHAGDRRLHYEVSRFKRMQQFELGLHFESRDKALNRYLLAGFQRHLVEIRHQIGSGIVVEPWDRGWAKLYDLVPEQPLTADFQHLIADRLAQIVLCCHPIMGELIGAYSQEKRKRRTEGRRTERRRAKR